MPAPALGDWVEPDQPIAAMIQHSSPMPDSTRQIERAIRGYWAQLSFLDNQLNRLVHGLQEHNVFDSTVILFVADHGEMLYDHRLVGKTTGNEGSARVPFMLRVPGAVGGTKERRVDAPVELRDVLPTLGELGGVALPDSVDGSSVVPLARGEERDWRPYVHGEHAGFVVGDNHWLTDGRTKYIRSTTSGREHLFDLDADPREVTDLASTRPDEVAAWRSTLVEELVDRPEGFVVDGELTTAPTSTAIVPGVLPGDEELQAGQQAIADFIRARLARRS